MTNDKMKSLVEWQNTSNGKKLFDYECAHLKDYITHHFVDRLLQISGRPLVDIHSVHHYVLLEEHTDPQHAPVPTVQANINLKLPFRDESFQAVVINHAHERVSSLPALLEEVERILVPEGSLIIYGINFTSLWAIAIMFGFHYVSFCHRLYSDFEVKKQLNNLGFQFEHNKLSDLIKPLNISRCFDMAYQAHYAVVAKKTISGMTLNLAI